MMQIAVITENFFLFQKIKLILLDEAECICFRKRAEADNFSVCLVDIDTTSSFTSRDLRMSRDKECELKIPFSENALAELIMQCSNDAVIKTSDVDKTVFVRGRAVKLTELEYSLFSLLLSESRFFTKEEILRKIWGENADIGIVNVYIHYLREKLEVEAERIIISARNKGYKINEQFLTEGT